ncbi:hypothetical protein O1611_g7103 [Lasiodiplodia mahajangana]|uniref:Uncharacterized protein n=1 Tax=Lasiodiplodia mahajangana TaxID=1108764 RepID=A0ACC2JH30_9PEZI|nr:hypothetical protein O1611_g7103 [Lasiodiplodia mahajangana]
MISRLGVQEPLQQQPQVEEEEDEEEEVEEDEEEEEEEDDDENEVRDEDMEGEEESDVEPESIGFALNERLRERAARHEAGEPSEHYEEEWEQWLKNAIDSGEFPFLTDPNQQPNDTDMIPQALFPPQYAECSEGGPLGCNTGLASRHHPADDRV